MKLMPIFSLMALTLLSACAAGIARYEEAQKNELARYTPYLGEPVSQFNMYTRWDGWSPVDDNHIIIRTNVNEAYLLTVAPVCPELPFATTRIALKQRFPNTVASGFDAVLVGRDTCRITEIRPVNYKQMRADLAEERKQLADAEE
jgi:hypothetical protein